MPPLIVSLLLDEAAQARFDALRQAHFPPERNVLAAHVTLFHALPGEHEQQVRDDLAEAAARPPFTVRVVGPRSLGGGVAYDLAAPQLDALRSGLAARWAPELSRQDRQRHRPHVTVQNKVPPPRARALLTDLQAGFAPYDVRATGLALWRYLGGLWEALETYAFSSSG